MKHKKLEAKQKNTKGNTSIKICFGIISELFCFTVNTKTHQNDSETDFKLKHFPWIFSVLLLVFLFPFCFSVPLL